MDKNQNYSIRNRRSKYDLLHLVPTLLPQSLRHASFISDGWKMIRQSNSVPQTLIVFHWPENERRVPFQWLPTIFPSNNMFFICILPHLPSGAEEGGRDPHFSTIFYYIRIKVKNTTFC